jgi:hypothetical protein
MTQEYLNASTQPLFTHNCQIKNALALRIMDNGSRKNLVSQDLFNRLTLVTTPHAQTYQLGWVQKDGPRLLVSKRCLANFSIGQFKDTVLCDVSPLDCVDFLLYIPYQTQINAIYLAKSHQYKITKEGHTYILIAAKPRPPSTKEQIPHVHLNQCVSLYLVHKITPNNTMHPVPENMTPHLATLTIPFISSSDFPYLTPLLTGWPQQK